MNESVSLPAFLDVLVEKVNTGAWELCPLLAFFCCFVLDRALSFKAINKKKK